MSARRSSPVTDRGSAREYWGGILRNNLIKHPAQTSSDEFYRDEHRNDFFTPDNLVVTVKTRAKHYTFGGRIRQASVSLTEDKIRIAFVPLRIPGPVAFEIDWSKIECVELRFSKKRAGR